jgi:hypothetical protein
VAVTAYDEVAKIAATCCGMLTIDPQGAVTTVLH